MFFNPRVLVKAAVATLCVNTAFAASFGWNELPDTTLDSVCPEENFNGYEYNFAYRCKNVILAWSGGAFDKSGNRLLIWGGGHNDYYGNEIYAVNLNTQTMARITDPAEPADSAGETRSSELSPFNGTQPNSRHTYDGVSYMSNHNFMWVFSGSLAGIASNVDDNLTWLFDLSTNTWKLDEPTGDIPAGGVGVVSAYDEVSGKVYLHNRRALYSYEYTEEGGVYTKLLDDNAIGLGANATIDPVNRKFVVLGSSHHLFYELDPAKGYARTDVALQGDTDFLNEFSAPGIAFNDKEQAIFAWVGDGKVYRFDNTSQTWSSVAFAGGPGEQVKNGTFGRFAYSKDLDQFIAYNHSDQNAFIFTLPEGTDDQSPSAPGNLTVTYPYPGSFQLTWTPSQDNYGVAHYQVNVQGHAPFDVNGSVFKSSGFQFGNQFNVSIKAVDSAGNTSVSSASVTVNIPSAQLGGPMGDCSSESQISERDDIVFCEAWESEQWYSEGQYLSDPIVDDPRPLDASHVTNTQIVEEGCINGKCLKINMNEGETKALSAYWPFINANQAPENVFARYYLKLANDWDVKMCKSDGSVAGAGGKFPGLADVRTWKDPTGQCGNGGASGDGENCWSMRLNYRDCNSSDGEACATKPNAAMRLGSYLYHDLQAGSTGDAGHWDSDDWGQSKGSGGSCAENPNNLFCGIEDHGVLERDIWYQVEMQVKMNTPGIADGVIRGWINGNLAYEKTNVLFRKEGHDFLHNRLMWLNIFKGGVYGNCQTSAVYMDQMVFALDSPVGSIQGAQTKMPPNLNLSVDQDDISSDDVINVNWQAENAESCSAVGLWQGDKGTEGLETIGPFEESDYVRMDCSGTGGNISRQLLITVDGQPIDPEEDNEVLAKPEGLTIDDQNENFLVLSWDIPANTDSIDFYYVRANGVILDQTTQHSFAHLNLIPGADLEYTVQAVSKFGNYSPLSEAVSVSIPPGDGRDNQFTLYPDSDTFIASSTLSALGERDRMEVSSSMNALLRFPVELIGNVNVTSAKLKLTSLREYGNMEMGVFKLSKEWQEDSTNRLYSITTFKNKWDNELGDWADALGQEQGDNAYSTYTQVDDDQSNTIVLDVTTLVTDWVKNGNNYGVLLKHLSGGAIHIASKENEIQNYWPTLEITFAREVDDYNQINVSARSDTFLATSTLQPLGQRSHMEISKNSNALLNFELAVVPSNANILQATLVINSKAEYGDSTIGGFLVETPWNESVASRVYSSSGVKWRQDMGDWVDANGLEHGEVALFEFFNYDDDVANEIRVDITESIQNLSNKNEVSFLLKMLNGNSLHLYSSEFNDGAHSPYIEIKYH